MEVMVELIPRKPNPFSRDKLGHSRIQKYLANTANSLQHKTLSLFYCSERLEDRRTELLGWDRYQL